MREIKFRAFEGKEKGMMESDKFDSLASFFGYYREQFYFDEEGAKDIPFMQFTGRIDKHLTEICEGDVLMVIIDGILQYREVFWAEEMAGFFTRNAHFPDDTLLGLSFLENASQIEVIGNIYQNPELIKQAAT